MAGDWIKMRANLATDPAVIAMAGRLGSSVFEVVGLLHWLWAWADQHTSDGRAAGVTVEYINAQRPGFGDALIAVGWLLQSDDGVTIPRFSAHNGRSAKARAMATSRQAAHRNAATVTSPLPEKRREEKRKPKPKPRGPGAGKIKHLLGGLDGDFSHLLEGSKSGAVRQWVSHLSERLASPYSRAGAVSLLERIDKMAPDDLEAAVSYSLDGNYQKLIIPPAAKGGAHGPHKQRTTEGTRRRRGAGEYPEPGGGAPEMA